MCVHMYVTQASKALHHKNHVIHALQLKILAMEEGMPLSDRPIEEAKTIKAWQGEGAILDGIHGGNENEDGNETLNALRIQLAKANEALIQSRLEIQEKEETIQELAHMLASREASQMALIETVQSYIAQQCVIPSLPATPTNATTAIGGTGIENWDADATQSQLEIIIERLHAQAEIGTKKLREVGLHEQGTHYET